MNPPLNESDLRHRLTTLHGGASGLRTQLPVTVTPDPSDSDMLHIRASDETIDRYGEIIAAAGWRLDNYLRNPIIQNSHQYGDVIFTIGRAEKTWVSGNALLQTWRFASAENPFARIARDLYRNGFLQAASVGFVPLRWEDNTAKDGPSRAGWRRRYLEQELLEVSAVSIPANPNALTLAVKSGALESSDLRELHQLLTHLIRTGSTHAEGVNDISRGPSHVCVATPPVHLDKDLHPEGVPQLSVVNQNSALLCLAAELRALKQLL